MVKSLLARPLLHPKKRNPQQSERRKELTNTSEPKLELHFCVPSHNSVRERTPAAILLSFIYIFFKFAMEASLHVTNKSDSVITLLPAHILVNK